MAFLENLNFDWYKNECFWQRITCTDNFDIGCQHHLGYRSSTSIQDLRWILLGYLRFLLSTSCAMPETAINLNRKIPIKLTQSFCGKVLKRPKNLLIHLTLLGKFKVQSWVIFFQIFVTFLEYMNFKWVISIL